MSSRPVEVDRAPADAAEAFEPLDPAAKKRMLIIVNPYATTVSDRLRHLVVYALQGRYEVDAVDTEAKGHAIELCREAAHEGYDVVVAFGGDGTVNEAANGLRGSSTPLTCLPGGSANVYGKILGIPGELVDATEHVLAMADRWQPRRVDLGVVNGRCFTFASGLGLDASVVERVDSNPHLKARFGAYYFTWAAISTFSRRYILKPPHLIVQGDEGEQEGVTAIVQNASPFTYFKERPIEVAEGPELDSGTLKACVLRRARPFDMPSIAYRAFAKRARVSRHRQVTPLPETAELTVHSADEQPLPLQVDGDYIGEVLEARYSVLPRELYVVS
ncbi:MAG TPA: diacylglycerol kinase family protein [Solirubrobacteraceae bacterium]|nr:diacylglycerol kinase family protein [Solirubrobacteraceae bacterium]